MLQLDNSLQEKNEYNNINLINHNSSIKTIEDKFKIYILI